MLLSNHWSVSTPVRLNDYHCEFALKKPFTQAYHDECYNLLKNSTMEKIKLFNWETLASHFDVWKNNSFSTITRYGTFHINSDPRNGSANIEIAAMCMDGTDVKVEGPWGEHPYTAVHALMHCAINARVAQLKGLNLLESFSTDVEPSVLQNGPIYVLSTHGERALQTNDGTDGTIPERGYFAYSGDSNCRWDLAALDERDAHLLEDPHNAVLTCKASAQTIRLVSTYIYNLGPMVDMFGLDK